MHPLVQRAYVLSMTNCMRNGSQPPLKSKSKVISNHCLLSEIGSIYLQICQRDDFLFAEW